MKIVLLGDFEGRFSKKLQKAVKDEEPDLVIYIGDFPSRKKTTKIEFMLWRKKIANKLDDKEFKKEFLKRADKIMDKEFESGKKIVKALADLNLPTLFVFGNHDIDERDGSFPLLKYAKKFKNLRYLHKKSIKIGDYTFVGHGGYRGFGSKQDLFKKVSGKEKQKIDNIKKRYRKELNKVFGKKKNVIFVTHDVPYNTKFDKIRNKESPINGEHIGDDIYREFALKKKPILYACGHMQEYQGKEKLGTTTMVLPGFGQEDKYAVIELPSKKIKFKTI